MTTSTLNHESTIAGQLDTSLEHILGEFDDHISIEAKAARSAEALLRFGALYGEAATQVIADWCHENCQAPDKVIANIERPLSYMALGATIAFEDETLNGPEVLGRHFGLPSDTFRVA